MLPWKKAVGIMRMVLGMPMAESENGEREPLYCPACKVEVTDPLACGDCGAVICRQCGTPVPLCIHATRGSYVALRANPSGHYHSIMELY